MACLVDTMQQMEEQYSLPQVESREPTHWIQAMRLAGLAAVRQANDMALERAGGGQHPFKLDAGDDIGVAAVAEFALARGVELVEARSQDDRAHIERDGLLPPSRGQWRSARRLRRTPSHSEHRAQFRHRSASARACSSVRPSFDLVEIACRWAAGSSGRMRPGLLLDLVRGGRNVREGVGAFPRTGRPEIFAL